MASFPGDLKGREPEWVNPKSSTGNCMNCTKKMCIPYPKNVEILSFEQLLKHSISKFGRGGGGKFHSVGLDHSGSQPFI